MSETVGKSASGPPFCQHCDAGHAAVWQPHSNEWVHRRSWTAGGGTTFSITLCTAKSVHRSARKKEAAA